MALGPNHHPFLVRRARPEDLEAAVDLFETVAEEGRWIGLEAPIDRQERLGRFQEALADDRRVLFTAVAGGEVVGLVWVWLAPYQVADLGMLVAAGWRRRGVGRALLDTGIEWARQAGAHKVGLQVWPHNDAALALYRTSGFVEEGRLVRHYRRRNGELWDAVVMGLVLDETSPGSSL